jgi:RNA polymerase sigma factor (sigma-70 family)
MIGNSPAAVVRHLRRVAAPSAEGDAELLQRFVAAGDDDAFAELVRRLGPMVWGVCRRVLGSAADADDAFQATFLVLARRAGNLRRGAPVAGWLHGVAYHVALRARAAAIRRGSVERRAQPRSGPEPPDTLLIRGELFAALDDELRRLPERDRDLLLRCDLDGDTHAVAAAALGCPLGSVARRLNRVRALMRERLVCRGVALAGISLVATPPDALAASAARLAVLSALGSPLPAGPASLAGAALRGVVAARAKLAVAAALVVGLLAVTAVGLARHPQPPPAPPADPGQTEKVLTDRSGDPLPAGALHRLGSLRFRHDFTIFATALSNDGKTVATGTGFAVWLWDADTGQLKQTLKCRDQILGGLAISPDGTTVAAIGHNCTLNRWDTATGKELTQRRLSPGGQGQRLYTPYLAYTGDGKCLIVKESHEPAVRVVDADTAAERHRFPIDEEAHPQFAHTPDGKTLAIAMVTPGKRGDDAASDLAVYDLGTGKEIRRWVVRDWVLSLAFGPDGSVVTGGATSSLLTVWDSTTGKEVRSAKWEVETMGQKHGTRGIVAIAVSPDGRTFVARSPSGMSLRDTASLREIRGWPCPPMRGRLWFLPDGRTLMVGGDSVGGDGQRVRFYDVTTGHESRRYDGHDARLNAVAVTPDGQTIITSSEGGEAPMRAWAVADGRELRTFGDRLFGGSSAIAVSPDGRTVAASAGLGVGLWDLATSNQVTAVGFDRGDQVHRIYALAFTPDGKQIVSGDYNGLARVSDLATKKTRSFRMHPGTAWAVALSADARVLASASQEDRSVYLWDVATGKERRQLTRTWQGSVRLAVSPDGRVVAASAAGEIQLWDAATGVEIERFKNAGNPWSLAFSPDGTVLAAGTHFSDKNQYSVVRWDLATGAELPRLPGHRGLIEGLAFSPDGTRLVSGSHDTTALVWGEVSPTAAQTAAERSDAYAALSAGPQAAARAAAQLARGRDQTVAFLKERLSAPGEPDKAKVAALIGQLESQQFAVRDKAARELDALGPHIAGELRAALDAAKSAEARARIKRALDHCEAQGQQGVRAVAVLDRIKTPAARALLAALAKGAPGNPQR